MTAHTINLHVFTVVKYAVTEILSIEAIHLLESEAEKTREALQKDVKCPAIHYEVEQKRVDI